MALTTRKPSRHYKPLPMPHLGAVIVYQTDSNIICLFLQIGKASNKIIFFIAASALLQSSLFGLVARFPQAYTQAIMGGMVSDADLLDIRSTMRRLNQLAALTLVGSRKRKKSKWEHSVYHAPIAFT